MPNPALPPIILNPKKPVAFLALLAACWIGASCTSSTLRFGASSPAKQSAVAAESLEYLRTFSREQQEYLKAMHESSPNWGAHAEALDYGDFLNEKTPRLLQIVEKHLPRAERLKFQAERAKVEAEVQAAEEANEMDAKDNEGGTLARLIRHRGTKIPMQVRIASLLRWTPYLPSELRPEIKAICERTAND